MHSFFQSDTYRALELATGLATAVSIAFAGGRAAVRTLVTRLQRARLKRSSNVDLASKSVHYLVTYTADQLTRSLLMLAYGFSLLALGAWFSGSSGLVGLYGSPLSRLIGYLFVMVSVVQLMGLSGVVGDTRGLQVQAFLKEGFVNHSEDWAAVNKHSESISNLREFAILLRNIQYDLAKRVDALDGGPTKGDSNDGESS